MNDIGRWIEQLTVAVDAAEVESLLESRPDLQRAEVVERLSATFLRVATADVERASRLAEATSWLAQKLDDERSRATSAKLAGHVSFLRGRFEEALGRYHVAVTGFLQVGDEVAAAETRMSSLTALAYLGRYADAEHAIEQVEMVFRNRNDLLGLARLDTNAGNILHRQDRHAEALQLYRRALARFRDEGDAQDVAAALFNIAVCEIGLGAFDQAEATYGQLIEHCRSNTMPLVEVKADYNIAYLHFLRGDYARAIRLYQLTRTRCIAIGETYHRALCDLDQAEIFLELSMSRDARRLAHLAFADFKQLSMGYESAKALVFVAVAESQMQRLVTGLELLDRARGTFEAEHNQVWQSLVDLHSAAIMCEHGRLIEAEGLARSVLGFFDSAHRPAQAVEAEIVLSRTLHRGGRSEEARRYSAAALDHLSDLSIPALEMQSLVCLGRAEESLGRLQQAFDAFTAARGVLERLRTHIRAEHVALGFHNDKADIHQALVSLTLSAPPTGRRAESVLVLMEEAKSLRMADLLAFHVSTLQASQPTHSTLVGRIRQLRERLNWYDHQIRLEELQNHVLQPERLARMRDESREVESRFLLTLSELRRNDEELGWLHGGGCLDAEVIRSAVPRGQAMIEYFEARGQLSVCVVCDGETHAMTLAASSVIREEQRLLQFQLSKLELGPEWASVTSGDLEAAARVHLHRLYNLLIAPIRPLVDHVEELVFIPDGSLFHLPFHALHDGLDYVCSRWVVSFAPSASVYALSLQRKWAGCRRSLVLGLSGHRSSLVADEVEEVARALHEVTVQTGGDVTMKDLEASGRGFGRLHIASSGITRRDNPMFSAIPIANTMLTMFDLYQLDLDYDLVAVTGCGPGLGFLSSGDELLGLTRGLLYAGARTTLVSLWDARGPHMAGLLGAFYHHLDQDPRPAHALTAAIRETRRHAPHPFHWASLAVVGATGCPCSPDPSE